MLPEAGVNAHTVHATHSQPGYLSICDSRALPVSRCPSCSNENHDGARHCRTCGQQLVMAMAAPSAEAKPVPAMPYGGVPLPQQPLAPNTLLANRYRIVRALKAGGMGSIYLGADTHLHERTCAIKEMSDTFATADERIEGQLWFEREAQILASLQHDCIPEIYDYFVEGGRYYLALEYIEGENLEDRLARMGAPGLPEIQVLLWAAQVSDVLHYLHTYDPPIVFRDLKPANVMVTADNTIRLVDFGIARVFTAVRQNTMIGTPGYSPPEQYQGLADPLSDLYALAASVHHLLSGRDPRDGQPFVFPPLRKLVPAVSAATESLLEGALKMELRERAPDVQEFGKRASRIAGELAQGLVPGLNGTVSFHVPGDPLPPTRMVVPFNGMYLGRMSKGTARTIDFPISNDGQTELRTVLHATAPWLHVPYGQLRVPCGSSAHVPIQMDATNLPIGTHRARIELDGNGGAVSVPVEVQVSYWLFNGTGPLLLAAASFMVLLAIAAHLLLQQS